MFNPMLYQGWKMPYSITKAVEYGEAGKGNALVKEIMRMLKEGEMP